METNDGTWVEWVFLKPQFWILLAVHIAVYFFCCYKCWSCIYDIVRIIQNDTGERSDDGLNNSLIDGRANGELARSNSEVIRLLEPADINEIDTDTKECCICSNRFDGKLGGSQIDEESGLGAQANEKNK